MMRIDTIFLQFLNMGLTASYMVLGVLMARYLLKNSPKAYSHALWSVVLFRLLCPISFVSGTSFLQLLRPLPLPKTVSEIGISVQTLSTSDIQANAERITAGLELKAAFSWLTLAAILWISGILALLLHTLIARIRIGRHVKTAVKNGHTVYVTDRIDSPFMLGMYRPRIYLPLGLSGKDTAYILAHETSHIKRFDHITKPIAFLALVLNWYNPMMWLAFKLMSKDMEQACDERVLRLMGSGIRSNYASLLLKLSTSAPAFMASPLAFGESDVPARIKGLLNYRKPTVWISGILVAVVIGLLIFMAANPNSIPFSNHDTAQKLFDSKTDYVGDNSKVGSILNLLSSPENATNMTFELETAQEPYGITVHYQVKEIINTQEAQAALYPGFQQNALILYSLIGNVTNITFIIEADGIGLPYNFNRLGSDQIWNENQPVEKRIIYIGDKEPDVRLFSQNMQDFETYYQQVMGTSFALDPMLGLDLYVWKTVATEGTQKIMYTLLPSTPLKKNLDEIQNLSIALDSIAKVNALLKSYPNESFLSVLQMRQDDFTKEEMIQLVDQIQFIGDGLGNVNVGISIGLYEPFYR